MKGGFHLMKCNVDLLPFRPNYLFVPFFDTLEYLITVQHLLNVHNGKLVFIWLAKKDNLMLLNCW